MVMSRYTLEKLEAKNLSVLGTKKIASNRVRWKAIVGVLLLT